MSLNRYDTKRDANEPLIVETLRRNGISVYAIDKPLDLLCGYGNETRLAEVKDTRNKRGDPKPYTPTQKAFLDTWKGGHTLLVTVEDAMALAVDMKRKADTRSQFKRVKI